MPDVRIGKRAQVVIPAAIRRELDLGEGDLLHLSVDDEGRIILQRTPDDPLARLRAAAGGVYSGIDAVEEQRQQRAEWER